MTVVFAEDKWKRTPDTPKSEHSLGLGSRDSPPALRVSEPISRKWAQ